jgi:serine/threonine protein kinase
LTLPKLTSFHQRVVTGGASSRDYLLALEGAVFDGRFEIERRVAEGGFAVVYRAYQVALDRLVALKVLKARSVSDEVARTEFRQKFAAEARTIARLRHPHIVDVYDFSVSALPNGELAPWMALEWLEGETLATRLAFRRESGARGLAPREALEFLRPVVEALAYAHSQGVIHRDVKPANVMVSRTANGESLRVLDFGIAKIVAADELPNTGNTRTESAPAFSPAYAAPEQVSFSRTGAWTDVHALGLLLTEVMTDLPPFANRDPEAHLFEQVMARERPTPASKGWDVGAFESLIAKAVALSPRERWRNAAELLEALELAARGHSLESAVAAANPDIPAPPSGAASEDAASPVRRSSGMAAKIGAAIAAVAFVVAVIVTRTSHHPSGILRPRAEQERQPPTVPPSGVESARMVAPPLAPVRDRAITPEATVVSRQPKPSRPLGHRVKKPPPVDDGRDLFDDTK